MSRVGVLGGTFDPIHVGHLDVARAARAVLALDRVVVLPSHVPPHRSAPRTSAAHRFAMAALAAQGDDGLIVSDLELTAPGPSYTADVLDRLAALGIDTPSLFFITGADAFVDIGSWKAYPGILDRCHFVAVSRPGHPARDLRRHLPALVSRMHDAPCPIPAQPGIFLVERPTAEVSSTELRKRIAAGESITGLVPDAVARHIARHRLYAEAGGADLFG